MIRHLSHRRYLSGAIGGGDDDECCDGVYVLPLATPPVVIIILLISSSSSSSSSFSSADAMTWGRYDEHRCGWGYYICPLLRRTVVTADAADHNGRRRTARMPRGSGTGRNPEIPEETGSRDGGWNGVRHHHGQFQLFPPSMMNQQPSTIPGVCIHTVQCWVSVLLRVG
ncbi:hypothetical protein EX30DRAFT_342836 [Ascodesmis nigricans]|uniref:Uncharacterized protein n=1 Tax=Ascodesmis nigricans TaxID=341454 RepID=A0A4S2MNT3_9PEZI|nr:hypothetical protein EX30DRAFT_342836 [Ascodesmis nigricans]